MNNGELFDITIREAISAWIEQPSLAPLPPTVVSMFNQISATVPSFDYRTVIESIPIVKTTRHQNPCVIADVCLRTSNNEVLLISIKDHNGYTFANLGTAGLLLDDYSVNTAHRYAALIDSIGLDSAKIQAGLALYENDIELLVDDSICNLQEPISVNSPLYNIVQHGWGSNYIYAKRTGATSSDWRVVHITSEFVDSVLIKSLMLTKISYPSSHRKHIELQFENAVVNYTLQIRNSKGGIIPKEMKISVKWK